MTESQASIIINSLASLQDIVFFLSGICSAVIFAATWKG